MRFFVCLTLAVVLAATAAHANDCENPISQKAMTDCAQQDLDQSDTRLNALYTEIKTRLKDDAHATKKLVAAQRAWIAFRDSECAFAASGVEGGSIYNYVHTTCLDRRTATRVADFERYLACQEGDLSCPVGGE